MALQWLGLGILVTCSLVASQDPPVVEVPGLGGQIQGTRERSEWTRRTFFAFKGIRFGLPPVNAKRFKASETAGKYWTTDPLMAENFGRTCPQLKVDVNASSAGDTGGFWERLHSLGDHLYEPMENTRALEGEGEDEDCLFLHIYTPTTDSTKKLPVMVYFHGGAFLDGSAYIYGPDYLLENDVVLVVPHYRLGPLGFLCMHNDEIPGNAAMYDQVLALQWVQDHISAFGGNPEEVTAFGESAGAASVSLLSVSPIAKGLFKRIIAQSGSGIAEWAIDLDPVMNARGVAIHAGCEDGDDAAITQCLMEKPAKELVRAYKYSWKPYQQSLGQTGFGGCVPVVQQFGGENKFLEKMPLDYWREPGFTTVPGMYGANKHEGTYVMAIVYDEFLRTNGLLEDQEYIKYNSVTVFLDLFGIKDTSYVLHDALETEYIGMDRMGNLTAMIPGMIDFSGATFLKGPGYENVKLHSKQSEGNSYWYAFNFLDQTSLWLAVGAFDVPFTGGVSHANDLLFLFKIPVVYRNLSDKEVQMAETMSKLWYNYAAFGETQPEGNRVPDVPDWPAYNTDTDVYMRLDFTNQNLTFFPNEYTISVDDNFDFFSK